MYAIRSYYARSDDRKLSFDEALAVLSERVVGQASGDPDASF